MTSKKMKEKKMEDDLKKMKKNEDDLSSLRFFVPIVEHVARINSH